MARKAKVIPGPSHLSKILEGLRQAPRPEMAKLKSLKLTYAMRNDHFGARHFVKNDLPRIVYVNPAVEIEVNKVLKTKDETWKPEMVVGFKDGTSQTLDLDKKWSSTIFQELMDLAGGNPWERWKRERAAAGLPPVNIPKAAPKSSPAPRKHSKRDSSPVAEQENVAKLLLSPGKTGAAAVLP